MTISPLTQVFGIAAITTAILAWPVVACVSLAACFALVILAASAGQRLP